MTPGGDGEPTRREGDDAATELVANDVAGRTRLGGRGPGGPAGSPEPAGGSAPDSRRAVLLAAAIVVLVFVAAVGVTLWVTRGTVDPQTAGAPGVGGSPTTTTTVTVPGPGAPGPSSLPPATLTVAGTVVVTASWTTVVPTVEPDQAVVDDFCTPLAEVPGDIDAVIAAWAGGSRSASAAENANEALAEMYRTITSTVWTGEPSATAVPAMANIWRFSLARLRGVLNTGGTSAFSSAAWDQAVRDQRLAAAGFLDECAVASGAAPMTLDPATAEKACGAVLTQLHSAVGAVGSWSSAPTTANTVDARDELELLLEAAESVGAEFRISVGHPVRRQTEGIRIDAEALLEDARAAQEPSAAVVSRFASAETALEPLC